MLELRPICEHCAADLPPAAADAMICSFECTFCRDCALGVFDNTCPNCGGGFVPRPVRPVNNWNGDNYLGVYPASTTRRHRPADLDAHRELRARIGRRAPEDR
jgi:uncharacterized protein